MKPQIPGSLSAAVIIFAAGITLRLIVLALCLNTPLFGDALAYHKYALLLAHGESFDTVRAPGLSLWLATWYSMFGSGQLVSMLAILPFQLILSAAVYLIAARRFGTRTATAALALVTFYPALVFHSVWPLTQLPMAALLAASLYLLDNRQSTLQVVAAGLMLGFAVLIRPNAVSLIPAFIVLLVLYGRSRIFRNSLLLAITGLAPALLWSAREYRASGNLVFVNYTNSMNLYLGNNRYTPLYKTWWFGSHGRGERDVPPGFSALADSIRALPLGLRDRTYRALAAGEIRSKPVTFAIRTLSRFRAFFAFDTYTGTAVINRFNAGKAAGAAVLGLDLLFYLVIAAAALVYLFQAGKDAADTQLAEKLVLLTGAYGLPFWIAFAHPTYHLPVMPLLAIPAAAILEKLRYRPRELKGVILRPGTAAALAILLLIQAEWVLVMLPSFGGAH